MLQNFIFIFQFLIRQRRNKMLLNYGGRERNLLLISIQDTKKVDLGITGFIRWGEFSSDVILP